MPGVHKFEKDIQERSMRWLARVGLEGQANLIAQSLPYGMQRRVEIARALATEPNAYCWMNPVQGLTTPKFRIG